MIVSVLITGMVGAHAVVPENVTEEIVTLGETEDASPEIQDDFYPETEDDQLTDDFVEISIPVVEEGSYEDPEPKESVQEPERKKRILLGVQIPQLTYECSNLDDGCIPLPCSAVSIGWSDNERFVYGTEVRFAGRTEAAGTRHYVDLFATGGLLSPTWSFSEGECIAFIEGNLFAGITLESADTGVFLSPTLGTAGKVHVGRDFLVMTFGIDATATFDVSGRRGGKMAFSVRPSTALTWRWF